MRSPFASKTARHRRNEQIKLGVIVFLSGVILSRVLWPDFYTDRFVRPDLRDATASSVYYRNCDAARADGAAPIRRGQSGYRAGLDADHDGIACEPYRPD